MRSILLWPLLLFSTAAAQDVRLSGGKIVEIEDQALSVPLFTVVVDGDLYAPDALPAGVEFDVTVQPDSLPGWRAVVRFRNVSPDTVQLENVVPLGQSERHPYITASGPWSLSRTKLFRPGSAPIGVILPDNAWEMGYASMDLGKFSVAAVARRTSWEKSTRTRWHTDVLPGGWVTYTLRVETFDGSWQNGLRLVFRDRHLYDLSAFDETLYEREDLAWIRDAYVAVLQMAWDRRFFSGGRYRISDYLEEGRRLLGGYDVYGIWPTWPRLGLDERNQWDLYRDLPGGLSALRQVAEDARALGTKFFIAYNPWDQSTRSEDHLRGMAELIEEISADGVVLDTRGSSSYELQRAADSVRAGVVMYSEGMAVPRDMPGIISGRVHNAIEVAPPLNLNKLIRPQFAIFRVTQRSYETMHRDVATSFFNGYGVEINTFHPGRPPLPMDDYLLLGQAARILREHSRAFHSHDWTPLAGIRSDSIWVNAWPDGRKMVYTIYSLKPEGFDGALIEIKDTTRRFVDLWHHEEIDSGQIRVDAFDPADLHTQREGAIGAVAAFEPLLALRFELDTLHVSTEGGDRVLVWAGDPSYRNEAHEIPAGDVSLNAFDLFGTGYTKLVVQLFDGRSLIDERIIRVPPDAAFLVETASDVAGPANEMVYVPAAVISPDLEGNGSSGTGIMTYPVRYEAGRPYEVSAFHIDRYPVTNREFAAFLEATGYLPQDTSNFLRHWVGGRVPDGLADHPVVYVSLEDARAFARWAGKRLPSELEWQLAAQGTDGRLWPWGNAFDSTKCNTGTGRTTPVNAYPDGASPSGVMDLVGNVWQLTEDVYVEGDYRFVMIRGGSFYNPTSSWWYMNNGPRPLTEHQVLLMVSPGFDRSSTVGFRCTRDVPEG